MSESSDDIPFVHVLTTVLSSRVDALFNFDIRIGACSSSFVCSQFRCISLNHHIPRNIFQLCMVCELIAFR